MITGGAATGIYFAAKTMKSRCTSGMTYNEELGECVPICQPGELYYMSMKQCSKCPPGQTFNQGKCMMACENDQESCGAECINSHTATCVNDNACPLQKNCKREYIDSNGSKQCCDNCVGLKLDTTSSVTPFPLIDDCCKPGTHVDDSGTCAPCSNDETACGQTCCPKDTLCCNGQCCPEGQVCDKSGICCDVLKMNNESGLCCTYEGGGDSSNRCCSEGEIVQDNKCMIPCPQTPVSGKPQSFCDPNATPPQYCNTVKLANGTSSSGCTKRLCNNEVEFHPNPANLYPPNTPDNAGIPVCGDKDGKNWFCKGTLTPDEAGLNRQINTQLDNNRCTAIDCWGQLGPETGATFDTYDTGGNCKATIDCSTNANTSAECSKTLATDPNADGWETSIFNPSSPTYNNVVNAFPDVICRDSKGDATGQICPDHKVCNQDGNCVSGFALIKDGSLDPGGETITAYCKEATFEDIAAGAAVYNKQSECQAALTVVPCPKGFARSGVDPNSLQCYRYGFPTGWNPGTCMHNLPCQLSEYRSEEKQMKTDFYKSGFLGMGDCHPYCTDNGTVVPKGAYYCRGSWTARDRNPDNLSWRQCLKDGGCTMNDNKGDPYGQRYSYNNDHSDQDIGFCVDPGYGVSPTNIKHPRGWGN